MLVDFGYVGLFLVIGIGFALIALIIPVILRLLKIVPRKPNPTKTEAFECGMPTIGKTWVRFNFRYYFYTLVFLALDIFVVFVYPWAVQLGDLGIPAFIVMLVFIAIIVVGYVYAWKKKVLEWK